MLKFKLLNYFAMFLLFVSFADAAIIHGTVYDMSLEKMNNVRVEINTSPKQFLVAQNGSYSFNVPNGAHTIKAQLMEKNTIIASVQENITIIQDGSYVLDLILFPDIEEGIEEINIDVNEGIIEANHKGTSLFVFLIILISTMVLIAISIIFYYSRNQEKEQIKIEEKKIDDDYKDDNLEQIVKIIKQEGGRITQKEIRKQIPLSEAKISLMITELEHKGIIEKIKKGRGNILIFKKK